MPTSFEFNQKFYEDKLVTTQVIEVNEEELKYSDPIEVIQNSLA